MSGMSDSENKGYEITPDDNHVAEEENVDAYDKGDGNVAPETFASQNTDGSDAVGGENNGFSSVDGSFGAARENVGETTDVWDGRVSSSSVYSRASGGDLCASEADCKAEKQSATADENSRDDRGANEKGANRANGNSDNGGAGKRGAAWNFFGRLLRNRAFFLIAVVIVCIACALSSVDLMMNHVNYNMTDYLPDDSEVLKGYEAVAEYFGSASMCRIFLENVSIEEAYSVCREIKAISEGSKAAAKGSIAQMLWLDTYLEMLLDLADNDVEPVFLMLEERLQTILKAFKSYVKSQFPIFSDGFIDLTADGFLNLVREGNEIVISFTKDVKKGLGSLLTGSDDLSRIARMLLNPDGLSNRRRISAILEIIDKHYEVLETLDLIMENKFYNALSFSSCYNSDERSALITVSFSDSDYSAGTTAAMGEIKAICNRLNGGDDGIGAYFDGTAAIADSVKSMTVNESLSATLVAVPFALIVLILMTTSFCEPLLYIFVILLSVVLNIGTNIIFVWLGIFPAGVSFITNSMSAVLQMAITMDYSIFFFHKYKSLRATVLDREEAMRLARRQSFSTLLSSCLTTVIGFVAISFMRFTLGADIGFVFTKGVLLSFIVIFLFMPGFMRLFDGVIDKTKHKTFLPEPKSMAGFVLRRALPITLIVLILAVPAFLLQNNLEFTYGEGAMSSAPGTQISDNINVISKSEGYFNPMVIIIDRDSELETNLINELDGLRYLNGKKVVKSILAYRSFIQTESEGALGGMIGGDFASQFYSADGKKARIIVDTRTESESEDALYAYDAIKGSIEKYTRDYYFTGMTVAAVNMRDTVTADYKVVNFIAIVAAGVVVMLMFKSLAMPVILVSAIEIGIFFNMAIARLAGVTIPFLGYLIVSLVLLGATIDYAILLARNYITRRENNDKETATKLAISDSFASILTSALIFFVVGYALYFMSSVATVKAIGELVGRGGICSGILVLIFLPAVLKLCDGFIKKFSLGMKFYDGKVKESEVAEDEGRNVSDNVAISASDGSDAVAVRDGVESAEGVVQGGDEPAISADGGEYSEK